MTTAFAPLSGQRTRECRCWLCDCVGLRVDFDCVRGLEQGLSCRGHCQSGVCFGQSTISCTMKAKKALPKKTFPQKTPHAAEVVLDAETTLWDQPVEALFRSPQGALPHSLAHDPVAGDGCEACRGWLCWRKPCLSGRAALWLHRSWSQTRGFRPCWQVPCWQVPCWQVPCWQVLCEPW